MKPIKNELDYNEALDRLNELFDSKVGTPESDEADVLAILINDYESKVHSLTPLRLSKFLWKKCS